MAVRKSCDAENKHSETLIMINKTPIEKLTDRFPETDVPGLDFLIELALDLSWAMEPCHG